MRIFLSLFAIILVIGFLFGTPYWITPVSASNTATDTHALKASRFSHTSEEVVIPEGTQFIPVERFEINGIDYWRGISPDGAVYYVAAEDLRIEYSSVPYKIRVAWIFGWRLSRSESGILGMCYEGECYSWAKFFVDGLFVSPVKLLMITWLFAFMFLGVARFSRYESFNRRNTHVRAILGGLAGFAIMGLANVGLWYLFLFNKTAFFSAFAGVAVNVFFMSLVTLKCDDLEDESVQHKLTAVILTTVSLTILGFILNSGLEIWQLILLSSPVGIAYAFTSTIIVQLFMPRV